MYFHKCPHLNNGLAFDLGAKVRLLAFIESLGSPYLRLQLIGQNLPFTILIFNLLGTIWSTSLSVVAQVALVGLILS